MGVFMVNDNFYKGVIAGLSGILWIFELVYLIGVYSSAPVYYVTRFVLITIALVAICALLYTDNETKAFAVGKVLISFVIVGLILDLGDPIGILMDKNTALYKSAAAFELISTLALIICVAIIIIEQVKGSDLGGFLFASMCVFVVASLVSMILFMCSFAPDEHVSWTYYIRSTIAYAIIPWLVCAGYYYMREY